MKLLANENIPQASVLALRNWGYDILSIGEENPSIQDHEVVNIAFKEERLILTFDRDYGEMIFKKGMKPPNGVLYLRIDPFSPAQPAEVVHQLIQSKKFIFDNYLTVVHNNLIRQRKY